MLRFASRRSAVYGRSCMVASSQPLASNIGLDILKKGGNAVDAAIAIAAALNVTEPCSTGLGGDCFLLYYNKAEDEVYALNGSGRCPEALTLDKAKSDIGGAAVSTGDSDTGLPLDSVHCVTVPGTAAGWDDAIAKWGTMPLKSVLKPAIDLAEQGFAVGPVTAQQWKSLESQLRGSKSELLIDGRAPMCGEVFKNQALANVMRKLGEGGKRAFYEGDTGKAICAAVQSLGGCLDMSDLKNHKTTFPDAVSVKYRDEYEVYQVPPNGQGITTLMAMNLLDGVDVGSMQHNSTEHLHMLIEFMRLAFADSRYYVADSAMVEVPTAALLSKRYAEERRKLFNPVEASVDVKKGTPPSSSDTVSFQVVDAQGNAVSMVNSNYHGFGSGIVPQACGFSLQNRGANFSLEADHPNVLAPGKRPYHTIIPTLAKRNGKLFSTFTVMGGFMQPQGQLQVFSNMVDFNMDPQSALDASRFCIVDGTANGVVALEDGIDLGVVADLKAMGHKILVPASTDASVVTGVEREVFGRGQIITVDAETGVLCAGSDGRADGCAMGY